MTSEVENQSPTAPRPEPERIASLINRINSGDIKLPTFQRPRVWNISQAIDLLDSIYKGYPIGSLLFWRTSEKLHSERNIGGFELPATPEQYPRNYVLDGQQRLTTLYAILTRHPDQLDERLKVAYDLKKQKFIEVKGPLNEAMVPLNVLYDMPLYMDFANGLREQENGEALVKETQTLWETFHEYVIPVVTVLNAPVDKVGIIFERINSRGTRLTVFDLMVAATWGSQEHAEFNLREKVTAILEQIDEKDYGTIEDVTVLRCFSVVSTGSARREAILGLRKKSQEDLELLIEKTRTALTSAVDFFVSHCSAVSGDFLPYERQLTLLTYVMAQRPSLTANDIRILTRWFWRTSFAERYRAGGEALFDEDLKTAIVALDTPEALKRYGEAPDKGFFVRSEFRKGAAASQSFAVLLGYHHPRNLTNGQYIDVGTALSSYNRKEFHHIFPQKVLKDRGTNKSLISALANICMLAASENKVIGATPPSEYIKELEEKHGEEFEEVMESNLIPLDAVDRLLEDDFTGFLEARSTYLSELIGEYI